MKKAVSHRISQMIEIVESRSAESSHTCAPPEYARKMGIKVERVGSAVICMVSGSESVHLNRVVGLGMRSPSTPHQLDRVLSYYQKHGIRRFGIALSPAARPVQLDSWLRRRGFRKHVDGAKLYRNGAKPSEPKTNLRIERVGASQAKDWVRVLAAVFPNFRNRQSWYEARVSAPGWVHYIAYAGRTPVSIGALFVENGVGHLTDGATLAPYRRRGAQSAIIYHRIADGLRQGCELFTSETAPPKPRKPLISYRNMLRAGFGLAYIRHKYIFDRPYSKRG